MSRAYSILAFALAIVALCVLAFGNGTSAVDRSAAADFQRVVGGYGADASLFIRGTPEFGEDAPIP